MCERRILGARALNVVPRLGTFVRISRPDEEFRNGVLKGVFGLRKDELVDVRVTAVESEGFDARGKRFVLTLLEGRHTAGAR